MKSEGKRIYVKALIITLISLMCSVRAWSQAGVIYPVDINVTLTPPYGTCLTDLTNSDRFRIQALMRDMSHPEYEMVIQMMIRDLSSLSPVFISTTNAFSLTAGEPTKIIGRDVSFASIADFFNFQNIRVGVQYVGTKCLPEGAYLFSFQAFDAKSYRTNRIPISREVTFSAFLEGGEVPILTYPAQNDSICDVQSIHFTWMQPFVSSGVNTYRLQILKSNTDFPLPAKELLDNPNTNDRIEVTTLIPSYTFHDTYNFLEEKTTYYWRVVLCDADGNARLSYPNKGASEVRSFVYCGEKKTPEPDPDADWVQKKPQVKSIKDNLDVVKLIKAEEDGPDVVRAFCKKDEQEIREKYSGIIVEVKKKSHDTWTPFCIESQEVEDTTVSLGNLAYNELYEARAQYYIDDGESTTYAPYSETIEFSISNPNDTVECGNPLPELNSDCAEAPKELKEGDKFSANGANVTVLEITSQSVEGNKLKISGTGYVNFPILRNFKLKVKFENAVLNCNLQLEDGTVESVYDLSTAATIDLNNLLGKGAGGYDLPETDPSIVDIPGIDPKNCEECKSYESGTLFSSGGEVYMKDENGAVVSVGKEIDLSTSGEYESNEIRKDNILVWFSNPDPANIAFDNDSMGYYRSIASINDQYTLFATNYITPWVANNPGRVVTLKAKPSDDFKKSGYTEPKFVLKTSATSYVELNNQPNGDGTYSVSIPGTDPSNITHIYAIARPAAGKPYENVGQLKVACYEKKTQKVILVPVANIKSGSNNEGLNAETVKAYLTSVYGKLGYSFDVEVDNDKSHIEGIKSDQISITSGVFTQYSDEMSSVINTYTSHLGDSYDESAAYLFLMNKASGDNSSVGGIMPQKHQFGFIFTGGTDVDNRTIAHELGHGLWGLDHTFVKAYKMPEGTTPHLMDYNNGIYLAHFEWSQIDKPVKSWALFNSDKDNEIFEDAVQIVAKGTLDYYKDKAKDTKVKYNPETNSLEYENERDDKSTISELEDWMVHLGNAGNEHFENKYGGVVKVMEWLKEISDALEECNAKNSQEEANKCICDKLVTKGVQDILGDFYEKLDEFSKDQQVLENMALIMADQFGKAKEMNDKINELNAKGFTIKALKDAIDNVIGNLSSLICDFFVGVTVPPVFENNIKEQTVVAFSDTENGKEAGITIRCKMRDLPKNYIRSISLISTCHSSDEINSLDLIGNMENNTTETIDNMKESGTAEGNQIVLQYDGKDQPCIEFEGLNSIGACQPCLPTDRVGKNICYQQMYDAFYKLKNLPCEKDGKSCSYLLSVTSRCNVPGSAVTFCPKIASKPPVYDDECTKAGYDNDYVRNPFGNSKISTKDATNKRKKNEMHFGVPKCSGWTFRGNGDTIVSPLACDESVRVKNLYNIKKGKTILNQNVAKNNLFKTFHYWDDTDSILVEISENKYGMLSIDEFVDKYFSDDKYISFMMDMYVRMNLVLMADMFTNFPSFSNYDAKKDIYSYNTLSEKMTNILSLTPGNDNNLYGMLRKQMLEGDGRKTQKPFQKVNVKSVLYSARLQNFYNHKFYYEEKLVDEMENFVNYKQTDKNRKAQIKEAFKTCKFNTKFLSLMKEFIEYLCGIHYPLHFPYDANGSAVYYNDANPKPTNSISYYYDCGGKQFIGATINSSSVNMEYEINMNSDMKEYNEKCSELFVAWENLTNYNSVLLNRIQIFVCYAHNNYSAMNNRPSGNHFRCDRGVPYVWKQAIDKKIKGLMGQLSQ